MPFAVLGNLRFALPFVKMRLFTLIVDAVALLHMTFPLRVVAQYDVDPDAQVPIMPIETLFAIDTTTDDYGGCAYIGLDQLNSIFAEAHKLARRGMQMVLDYNNPQRPEARRLVAVLFRVPEDGAQREQLMPIYDKFRRIRDWIERGGPLIDGTMAPPPARRRPHLFCHDSWFVLDELDSPMRLRDPAALTVPNSGGELQRPSLGINVFPFNNPNLPPFLIRGAPPLMDVWRASLDGINRRRANMQPPMPALAFPERDLRFAWSVWDQVYRLLPMDGGSAICGPIKLGATAIDPVPDRPGEFILAHITICFKGFMPRFAPPQPRQDDNWYQLRHLQWRWIDLGWAYGPQRLQPFRVLPRNQLPAAMAPGQGSSPIEALLTASSTLLHELFHLVFGSEATTPQIGHESYAFERCVQLSREDALRNPQTFVLAAYAYEATRTIAPVSGTLVEFYTGWATYGD
jgi:hypothetical protein